MDDPRPRYPEVYWIDDDYDEFDDYDDNIDNIDNDDALLGGVRDQPYQQPLQDVDPFGDQPPELFDLYRGNDPENAIDLTMDDLSDVAVPPSPVAGNLQPPVDFDPDLAEDELVTAAACLQMVLDVLPDISIDHVLNLIQENTQDHTRTLAVCERLVSRLLDEGTYPKEQDDAHNLKRKRGDEEEKIDFENDEENVGSPRYFKEALELLKDEFSEVPVKHLESVLRRQKSLFKSYGVVEEQVRNYGVEARHFQKVLRRRHKRDMRSVLDQQGSNLPRELDAAIRKTEKEAMKRSKAEEAKRAEDENLRQAQLRGEMGECQCCFDDCPINRMTSCNGETVHLFCLECARKYVEGEMGSGRCRPICFADPNCGGIFRRRQLQHFLGEKSFERLEHMQQQQEIAAAGLDFLSECPFCDFKAECLPVEVDKEFRCCNPKCRKTSCRLCQKETHIPLSCEEAKKDERLTVRHIVEEAMSAALIRHCNRCKHPFVKEYGCNKMTCSHCRNIQCYVCSKDVTDYNHFNDTTRGGRANQCPLHDNVEDRHEEEVKAAAENIKAKIRAENPDISDADLMIQVSDRVKRAENSRRGRAQADHDRFPFHMAGGVLREGPADRQARMALPARPERAAAVVPQYVQNINPIMFLGPHVAPQAPQQGIPGYGVHPNIGNQAPDPYAYFDQMNPRPVAQPDDGFLQFMFGPPPPYQVHQGVQAPAPPPMQFPPVAPAQPVEQHQLGAFNPANNAPYHRRIGLARPPTPPLYNRGRGHM